jgi:hypothetical protein
MITRCVAARAKCYDHLEQFGMDMYDVDPKFETVFSMSSIKLHVQGWISRVVTQGAYDINIDGTLIEDVDEMSVNVKIMNSVFVYFHGYEFIDANTKFEGNDATSGYYYTTSRRR